MTHPPEHRPPEHKPLEPPPPLNYGTPNTLRRPNSAGQFFKRFGLGAAMGVGSLIIGLVLCYVIKPQEPALSLSLLFGPTLLLGIVMIIVDISRKRFGYATGVFLPSIGFVIVVMIILVALFLLLLIMCGGMAK